MTRLVILGGFLGAGKTTVLLQAAQRLTDRGYKVGYVTNDQGTELVDTAVAAKADVPVVEIAGGCFCCRYPELITALQTLQIEAAPDIVLAEPVGSCTDLVATVIKPLALQGGYDLAPLSVLVDGASPSMALGPTGGYLQAKQWEEAQLVLLNKIDLASSRQLARREQEIRDRRPECPIYRVSGQKGDGIDQWIEVILGRQSTAPESLIIDYDLYAKAEEALGWLNARGQVRANQFSEIGPWVENLARLMAVGLRDLGLAVAHLKILAQDGDTVCKGSLVGSIWTWDLPAGSAHVSQSWEFLLNLRAVAEPAVLEERLWQGLAQNEAAPGARYYVTHLEAFAPLAPQPVHRVP